MPTAEPTIILGEAQNAVRNDVLKIKNVFVTGGAGTGKSVLLRVIRQDFKDAMLRCAVVGSTGISAVNVQGLTLHTWAGLGLADDTAEKIANKIIYQDNVTPLENIKTINHLCLDEVSMISAALFTKVSRIFQIVRKNNAPFGGMQLILFGDFLQLPPVPSRDENGLTVKGTDEFAFKSPEWKRAEITTHHLTKVYRQADQAFADCLGEVRICNYTEAVSELLRECWHANKVDPDPNHPAVILDTHNASADAINMERLKGLPGNATCYTANDSGSTKGLKVLEKCLLPETLLLKLDAQVMCVFNIAVDQGIANGTLGTVTKFRGRVPVVLFANGVTMEIEPIEFKVYENEKCIATRVQLPIRLAWAITVHKSQGMTLDKVRVHLGKAFEFGQAYVALSRARTKEGLFIMSGSRKSIKAHPSALDFYAPQNGQG